MICFHGRGYNTTQSQATEIRLLWARVSCLRSFADLLPHAQTETDLAPRPRRTCFLLHVIVIIHSIASALPSARSSEPSRLIWTRLPRSSCHLQEKSLRPGGRISQDRTMKWGSCRPLSTVVLVKIVSMSCMFARRAA